MFVYSVDAVNGPTRFKMAAIRTYDGMLAMTSGNCVAVSNIRNPSLFQTLNIPSHAVDKSDKKDDDDSLHRTGAGDGCSSALSSSSSTSGNRVLACGFSGRGRYFAVCDDLKMLHVYRTDSADHWTLLSSRVLARRATSLTFTLNESTVLVADKSGDVYSFPTATEVKDDVGPEVKTQGQLLLGHLSMVLDVCLADGEKYVVTCDRDEKIRLSHYPNAYNIHTYCLGHTQFVSCVTYVDEFRVLISGSGDCSLRVWNMEGKQLCLAQCPLNRSSDAVTSPQLSSANPQKSDENGDGEKNSNGKEEKMTDDREKVAIQSMTYCKECRLLVVSFYSHPELQVYRLSVHGEKVSLDLTQTIPLQATPWNLTFDDGNNILWVLSPEEGKPLSAFTVRSEDESGENADKPQLVKVEDDGSPVSQVLNTVNAKWDFFSGSLSVASNIPSLWKTSTQDQLAEYQQRKQQRLQGGAKDTQGPKDQGRKDKRGKKADGDNSVSVQPAEELPEKKPRVP